VLKTAARSRPEQTFTTQLWLHRIDQLAAAELEWDNAHTMPSASDLGIPPQSFTSHSN
jgi:hypothetical protein